MLRYPIALALVAVTVPTVAAEPNEAQMRWAKCSWSVYADYGLTDVQKKVVTGTYGEDYTDAEYEKWEDIDVSLVEQKCGSSQRLFSKDPSMRFKVLRQTTPD